MRRSVTCNICHPNCDWKGALISLSAILPIVCSNSGTNKPGVDQPRLPPFRAEPGSLECCFASLEKSSPSIICVRISSKSSIVCCSSLIWFGISKIWRAKCCSTSSSPPPFRSYSFNKWKPAPLRIGSDTCPNSRFSRDSLNSRGSWASFRHPKSPPSRALWSSLLAIASCLKSASSASCWVIPDNLFFMLSNSSTVAVEGADSRIWPISTSGEVTSLPSSELRKLFNSCSLISMPRMTVPCCTCMMIISLEISWRILVMVSPLACICAIYSSTLILLFEAIRAMVWSISWSAIRTPALSPILSWRRSRISRSSTCFFTISTAGGSVPDCWIWR